MHDLFPKVFFESSFDARHQEGALDRHADDDPSREQAVKRLVRMLKDLIAKAGKEGLNLAPFIGIACPGVIKSDGSIEKGAQNLPGN